MALTGSKQPPSNGTAKSSAQRIASSYVRTPGVILTVWRKDFDEKLLRDLHALSNRLMAEDYNRFCVHARTNDLVHVFRQHDQVVGFQFWRSVPMDGGMAIAGGKLRVLPEHRRRGLHLLSGLLFFAQAKLRRPFTKYYRVSLASIFGFVSITEALAEYELLGPRTPPEVKKLFSRLAEENHYQLHDDGRAQVDIFMTEETLSRFPASYFERPAARIYAAANPGFRTNGCYLAFWFRFTPRNIAAILKKAWSVRSSRSRSAVAPPGTPRHAEP
jgi:hypothetical protein